MDGSAALAPTRRRARETGASPTPVVALTARATRSDEARCLAAGFDGYLTKPFRSRQLREVIVASLGVEQTGPSATDEARPGGADLDWGAALAAVDGDRELLCKVVRGFLGQQPSLVAQLREALQAPDLMVVQRVAHTLSGSLRLFERSRVVERARQLEEGCRAGSSDRVAQEWRALEVELEAAVSELRRFVNDLP
jgi:CheY-like chemotaxis protein